MTDEEKVPNEAWLVLKLGSIYKELRSNILKLIWQGMIAIGIILAAVWLLNIGLTISAFNTPSITELPTPSILLLYIFSMSFLWFWQGKFSGILRRYVSLWLAHILSYINRFYRWMKSGWRLIVGWLIMIAIIEFFLMYIGVKLFNIDSKNLSLTENTVALYILLLLVSFFCIGRKRLVVDEFAYYSSDKPSTGDASNSPAKGLASLLVVELNRIQDVYRTTNEKRAVPTASTVDQQRPIDATLKVEDFSDTLNNAISAESKLTFGTLGIQIGTLMKVLGIFVRGSKITGSLYKEKEFYILTAQMLDDKRTYSWRIEDPRPLDQSLNPDKPNIRSLDDMVNELACRIFTDLKMSGSVRWKATWSFKEGLRNYRDCLVTSTERKLKLMQAEKRFMETLAEDKDFKFVNYNMGVVYLELRKDEAADAAFVASIEKDPLQWQPYYALGLRYFKQEKYDLAISMCERVITLKPDTAQAYDLKGLSQRQLAKDKLEENLEDAIESFQKAVSLSWKALCIAEIKGDIDAEKEDVQLKQTASSCLRNLAVAYKDKKELLTAKALLRQAIYLCPSNAGLHLELGKIYHTCDHYCPALQEYKSALQIEPTKAIFWGFLALAYAGLNKNKYKNEDNNYKKLELEAWSSLIELTFSASKEDREEICKVLELSEWSELSNKTNPSVECAKRIIELKKLYKKIEYYIKLAEGNCKYYDEPPEGLPNEIKQLSNITAKQIESILEKDLEDYKKTDQKLEYALVANGLGRLCLDKNPAKAKKYFEEAIDKLKEHPNAIKAITVRALLSRSHAKLKEYPEAMQEAEKARWHGPLRTGERIYLSNAYYDLNEYENAIAELQDALLYKPDNPTIYYNIGVNYYFIATDCRETNKRNESLLSAVKYLEHALNLYGNEQIKEKCEIHYWLGRMHYELSEYDNAISHLRRAKTLTTVPIPTLWLGRAYLKNNAYNECVEQCEQVIKDLKEEGIQPYKIIGYEIQDEMHVGSIFARAYLLKAMSYANRDASLEKAQELAEDADKWLNGLHLFSWEEISKKDYKQFTELLDQKYGVYWVKDAEIENKLLLKLNPEKTEVDVEINDNKADKFIACKENENLNIYELTAVTEKKICKSKYLDTKGWICYKQNKIEDAIKWFEESVSLNDDAEAYWHLALAYKQKLQKCENKTERSSLITKIEAYCQHAQQIDIKKEYSQQLKDLQDSLLKKAETPQKTEPDKQSGNDDKNKCSQYLKDLLQCLEKSKDEEKKEFSETLKELLECLSEKVEKPEK